MALGTATKRNKSLVAFGSMLYIPDGADSVTSRAAGVEVYYVSGECDELNFLITGGFTATPTSGTSRLKVVFKDSSTLYDYLQEVEESTVDMFIQESACTDFYVEE